MFVILHRLSNKVLGIKNKLTIIHMFNYITFYSL